MKKPNKKQIILIIIAILISAAIISFPFIWNAKHKAEKTTETAETIRPSVMSTVNPNTPENLLPDGYFKKLTYGTGPFTPSNAYDKSITENWKLPMSTITTNFSITFTQNASAVYNTATIALSSYSYGMNPYIYNTLDITNFATGEQYTVTTYLIQSATAYNTYITYTFTVPELDANKTFGAGPITGTNDIAITAEFKYTLSENSLIFKVGYLSPNTSTSYYPNMKIGAIKIEEGTRSTLQNDIEGTTPEPPNDYDTGYDDGYKAGYKEGFEQGGTEMKKELSAQLIGGPSIAWETVNPSVKASYDAATDTFTAGNMTTNVDLIKFDLQQQLAIGMTIIVEWDSMTTIGTLNVSFEYNYLTGTGKYVTITESNNTGQASFLIPQAALIENQTLSTIFFRNQSGADVNIKGLKIKLQNDATKNYQEGYQAGLAEGNKNAGQNYNNGYAAGLEAGKAEGTQSENFGNFIAAMFGSVLTFFLNVGNSVTIWDISLFEIAVSFIAIVVITRVVKNLI